VRGHNLIIYVLPFFEPAATSNSIGTDWLLWSFSYFRRIVESSFYCSGDHQLKLKLYPGGDEGAKAGYTSVHLMYDSESNISVAVDLQIIAANSRLLCYSMNLSNHITHFSSAGQSHGYSDFIKRSNVANRSVLVVRIKSADEFYVQPTGMGNIMMFQDEQASDIAFQVKDETFYAHKIILKAHPPD
jgi:hypothetical protein